MKRRRAPSSILDASAEAILTPASIYSALLGVYGEVWRGAGTGEALPNFARTVLAEQKNAVKDATLKSALSEYQTKEKRRRIKRPHGS